MWKYTPSYGPTGDARFQPKKPGKRGRGFSNSPVLRATGGLWTKGYIQLLQGEPEMRRGGGRGFWLGRVEDRREGSWRVAENRRGGKGLER